MLSDALKSLEKLEYRGYDSAGIATLEGLHLRSVGFVSNLIGMIGRSWSSSAFISHTRWATHGPVSRNNAHPHTNAGKDIFVVHNGIIGNHEKIRAFLESKGYVFSTETDTEVIPHYFDYWLRAGNPVEQVMQRFHMEIDGTYAVLVMRKGKKEICALRNGSPLLVGVKKGMVLFSSDIMPLLDYGCKIISLQENESCIAGVDGIRIMAADGKEILRPAKKISSAGFCSAPLQHEHHMISEILEQGNAASSLVSSLNAGQKSIVNRISSSIMDAGRVSLVGCGSSYHACLFGQKLFERLGIDARAVLASDSALLSPGAPVIALSQSGETMDVLLAVKGRKDVFSLTNVPYSSLERVSSGRLDISAGIENCVAATKSFTNQLIALISIAENISGEQMTEGLPRMISRLVAGNHDAIIDLAKKIALRQRKDLYILGSGALFPIALEIALKIKEIAYIHAEGLVAGELKHGTLALIEEGVPVVALIPQEDGRMLSASREAEARGADLICFEQGANGSFGLAMPECRLEAFAILSNIAGQLLAYHVARSLKRPIDRPRNLAKSVTVA